MKKVDPINGFRAIDDTTLQVETYAGLIILFLEFCRCNIVLLFQVKQLIKYGGDFRRHAVGTGPFLFVAWEEGQALIMKKNPNIILKLMKLANRFLTLMELRLVFLIARLQNSFIPPGKT